MAYIDFMVASVPEANKESYVKASKIFGEIFKSFGATEVLDGWGVDVPDGQLTSFPMAVKKEAGEVVVVGYNLWPSKAVRDEAHNKMMSDERMKSMDMPFDGKRMIFGGFEIINKA